MKPLASYLRVEGPCSQHTLLPSSGGAAAACASGMMAICGIKIPSRAAC
jgi:Asp-tRNA(Asn)/Glu-tRNA(Gln) amidotransferase A subunit family amidase